MTEAEPYPVDPMIKVERGITLRKSGRYWTAFLIIRFGKYENDRPILAFYRWAKRKKGLEKSVWKQEKKWTINNPNDWDHMKKMVDENLIEEYRKLHSDSVRGPNDDDENLSQDSESTPDG